MKTWLFRPFERIAGALALGLGLLLLLVTAWLASRAGLITDGVLDLHFAPQAGLVDLIVQALINWLSLSLMLLAAAWWLSRRRFRLLDLFATQALARWPMLIGVAYLSIPAVSVEINEGTARLLDAMPEDPGQVMAPAGLMLDAMWLMLVSLPVLAMMAWMIWLMYHAYALVSDLKGQTAVFSFVGALVLAEIISRALIYAILSS